MGSRGVFNFTMRLESHAGGHHSGNWGGLLTNPGVVMAHALASMVDRHGKILVEGWRNTHIPNSVRAAIAKLEVGGGDNAPEINPNWGEPDMTLAERVFASNTFEVRAFETGNPQSPANAIPPSAVVFGHLRYVVGTEVSQLMPLLRAHLDKHGFGDITITSERDPMYATRLDPDHPWAKWALESLEQTAGEEISSYQILADHCRMTSLPICLACQPSGCRIAMLAVHNMRQMSIFWSQSANRHFG